MQNDLRLPTEHTNPAGWEGRTLSIQAAVYLYNIKVLKGIFWKAWLGD